MWLRSPAGHGARIRVMPAIVVALSGISLMTGLPVRAEAATAASTISQEIGAAPSQITTQDVCPAPSPVQMQCEAQVLVLRSDRAPARPLVAADRTFAQVATGAGEPVTSAPSDAGAQTADAASPQTAADTPPQAADAASPQTAAGTPPQAGTPAWLQQAYDLTYLSLTAGGLDTVAIVDAYDDPTAESDLATYRINFGLAPCTSASGCFRKVDEEGDASPLPSVNAEWQTEESLDLDAVSALCPNCHILLVEADGNGGNDLANSVATAIALGANQISNSWGGIASTPQPLVTDGATVLAGTGDTAYPGAGEDVYPAALPTVTAVGGTSLTASSGSGGIRGFAESAWSLDNGSGAGSGCDLAEPKPSWQTDTGCTGRAYADISADADPATGLMTYDSAEGGWLVGGGTSLSTPLVAAFEAVTGVAGATSRWAYTDSALLNDPVTGSSGTCAEAILYICDAGPGYDGPTGVGSISGDVTVGAPGIGGPAIANGSVNSYTQSVSATTATLAGGVYPNGLDTSYDWQYGTSTAYGRQTSPVDAGAGPLPVAATATLTGLASSTSYHYRLIAVNGDGTMYGYDDMLTTGPASPSQPPAAVTLPSIGGAARQGHTLSASTGTWSPAPTAYAYQWQRSTDGGVVWQNIAAAASATYAVTSADIGAEIRVQVSATGTAGMASIDSGSVGPVTGAAALIAVTPSKVTSAVSVSARRLSRRRVRISARGKPRHELLLVRVGRRVYRTRAASLVIGATGARTVWVALQSSGRSKLHWMLVRIH